MVHYHYYIAAGRVIDTTSRFFRVAIGQSKQGDRDYLTLLATSVERHHYFALVDQDSRDFLEKIAMSLFPNEGCQAILFLTIVDIKARDLVKWLEGTIIAPISFEDSRSKSYALSYLSANYRASKIFAKRKAHLLSE